MNEVLRYLIEAILQLVAVLLIARFLLQACRADFYNPISQGIIRFTDPLLRPIRVVLPGYRNFDFAALFAVWITQIVLLVSLATLFGSAMDVYSTLVVSLYRVMLLFLGIKWLILIVILASFLIPGNQQPILMLLRQITEPFLAPARRLLPPMGGLDFSPMLVLMVFHVIGVIILPQILVSVL
ncbi:MAG: YggT family protein [Gammaproteobacteria bacterium]|nr:YggT family protein [Gammaproteobacteria bacterium]